MRPEALLDDTNRALIAGVLADPRATHRRLAADLGLNEVTVAARLRRLTEAGVLATTIAVDWRAAGYRHAAYLWVVCRDRPVVDVGEEISRLENVENVAVVLGAADLFVHALVVDSDDALVDVRSSVSAVKGATVVEMNVVLRHYVHRTDVTKLPIAEPALPALPDPVIELDDLDQQICGELASDARQSNREIARTLGTSERTVRARLKRLEDSGLVRIVAMVDRDASAEMFDRQVGAFVGIRTDGDVEGTAKALAAMPTVSSLTATSGDVELYAIVNASSVDALSAQLLEDIRSLPSVTATTAMVLGRALRFGTRLRRLL